MPNDAPNAHMTLGPNGRALIKAFEQKTELLTRYRAWQHEWAKADHEREWVTLGAGFLVGDGDPRRLTRVLPPPISRWPLPS